MLSVTRFFPLALIQTVDPERARLKFRRRGLLKGILQRGNITTGAINRPEFGVRVLAGGKLSARLTPCSRGRRVVATMQLRVYVFAAQKTITLGAF